MVYDNELKHIILHYDKNIISYNFPHRQNTRCLFSGLVQIRITLLFLSLHFVAVWRFSFGFILTSVLKLKIAHFLYIALRMVPANHGKASFSVRVSTCKGQLTKLAVSVYQVAFAHYTLSRISSAILHANFWIRTQVSDQVLGLTVWIKCTM